MSDWAFLNQFRVSPEQSVYYGTTPADGFNGMFICWVKGRRVRIIASDGLGWQHVSVSLYGSQQSPSWAVMCEIKDLFWEPEDTVMQLHPPRSIWVNMHPGCLHLWRPTSEGVSIPLPQPLMVGTHFESGERVPPLDSNRS